MLKYRDFYGGDLISVDDVNKARTKNQLKQILDQHESYMEDMLSDAKSHLQNFREKIKLDK